MAAAIAPAVQLAYPTMLGCERPLVVGHQIMGRAALSSNGMASAVFAGKSCGGTAFPGEVLTVSVPDQVRARK